MQEVINFIFIAGWYISAILFGLQTLKIFHSKSGAGVSVLAMGGFFVLNVNSTFWMYFHQYINI